MISYYYAMVSRVPKEERKMKTKKRKGAKKAIRVVLWHGAGDSFCAGNDVEDFLKNPPGPGESPQAKLMHALLNFERACLTALRPVSIWTVARISTSVLKRPASDCDKPFCFRDITKRPSG